MAPKRKNSNSENANHTSQHRRQAYIKHSLPTCIWPDPVHLYCQTLEFDVPLLHWRLRTKAGDGELCRSQVYTIPTKPATQWQFVIFKHQAEKTECGFRVSLIRAEGSLVDKVTVSGKLKVLYEERPINSVDFKGMFGKKSNVSSVFLTFKSEAFKDTPQEKDFFTFRCELQVLQSDVCNHFSHQETRNESLSDCLSDVWEAIDTDDVITIKLDDYECKAHKSILSARSPVFGAMFHHDTKEKQTNSITIQELERPILRLMMQFMYGNQIAEDEWNEQDASKLLKEADKYMLHRLKEKCEDFLIGRLSSDNCTRLCKLGTDCSAKRLLSEALTYVTVKLQQSISSPVLQEKISDHSLVQSILNLTTQLDQSIKE